MPNGTPAPEEPRKSANSPDRFDRIESEISNLTSKTDLLLQAVETIRTSAEKAQRKSNLLPLWSALVAAAIGASAAIIGSLITAHTTIEVTRKTLENATKVAFESARGTKFSEDYRDAKRFITEVEIGFRESAVQKGAKKSLEDGLAKLSSLALGTFRSDVPSLADLTRYAAQLLADYSTKKKHWEDYEQSERPKIEDLCQKASAELDTWANNQK
jgi:hypothetical protein